MPVKAPPAASDKPVGKWQGVETDAEGYIVRLKIYDNNLTGTLSTEVCKLTRLRTLHLSFNRITGALPESLGECRALVNLWLKGNKLTGRLPDSVAVLPKLVYLDIHANEMTGPLPAVWNTPKLKIVRAEDNRITGPLPEQLLRQPALEQLVIIPHDLYQPASFIRDNLELRGLYAFDHRHPPVVTGIDKIFGPDLFRDQRRLAPVLATRLFALSRDSNVPASVHQPSRIP